MTKKRNGQKICPPDLVFAPTLADGKVCSSLQRPTRLLSPPGRRSVLHLERAMLTGTLSGLRGPLCPRLASACNHRPGCNVHIIARIFQKNKRHLCVRRGRNDNYALKSVSIDSFYLHRAGRYGMLYNVVKWERIGICAIGRRMHAQEEVCAWK